MIEHFFISASIQSWLFLWPQFDSSLYAWCMSTFMVVILLLISLFVTGLNLLLKLLLLNTAFHTPAFSCDYFRLLLSRQVSNCSLGCIDYVTRCQEESIRVSRIVSWILSLLDWFVSHAVRIACIFISWYFTQRNFNKVNFIQLNQQKTQAGA